MDLSERVLPREDPEASRRVGARMARDRVRMHLGVGVERVERRGDDVVVVLKNGTEINEIVPAHQFQPLRSPGIPDLAPASPDWLPVKISGMFTAGPHR